MITHTETTQAEKFQEIFFSKTFSFYFSEECSVKGGKRYTNNGNDGERDL